MTSWSLVLPQGLADEVWAHHFPGDGAEHGGVVLAGVTTVAGRPRLIAREYIPALDSIDYVPGVYGYRRLTPQFVRAAVLRARDEGLAYLAVHNHGGATSVGFSPDDRASHARGYPALLDIARGQPVGALVLAAGAVAGELWLTSSRTLPLAETRVVGSTLRRLYHQPRAASDPVAAVFDRQTRIFGEQGQQLLDSARVAIIGAGGAGMLLVEYLSRLGVGTLVVVDPDRVSESNMPRLPGARRGDLGRRFARFLPIQLRPRSRRKVEIARRLAREANANVTFIGLAADVADAAVASALRDADFIFCAADSATARLVFNALVQQYGIPGVQVGAKVASDTGSGALTDVRSVVRPVRPGFGCLWCNGLISPARLAEESLSAEQAAAQRYVDDPSVVAPAVITLNAVAASVAANDFLLSYTGIDVAGRDGYLTADHRRGRLIVEQPRRDASCPECGLARASRYGRGDGAALPVRLARAATGFSRLLRRRSAGVA